MMICGAVLGKSSLVSMSFANVAIDECFEAAFNLISTE
jgi:hypothetical protein